MSRLSGPVLILPNISNDATTLDDLLSRFNYYGSEVFKSSHGEIKSLNIVAAGFPHDFSSQNYDKYLYLSIVALPNRKITFLINLRKILKSNTNSISMVIAGDPWLGYLLSFLAAVGTNLPVQVSIHGEPYHSTNLFADFTATLKHLWLKMFLQFADSVRLVSDHQIRPIIENYRVDPGHISISPIPIKIPKSGTLAIKKGRKIAFVGRLHKERGIDLWIHVVSRLFEERKDFSVVIVGDGPERNNFETQLLASCNGISYKFLGKITKSDVDELWNDVSILLSTAPTESYGLTLREAQMSGVYVVALENEGTLANSAIFTSGIFLFSSTESAVQLMSHYLDLGKSNSNQEKFRNIQSELNSTYLSNLIASWRTPKY